MRTVCSLTVFVTPSFGGSTAVPGSPYCGSTNPPPPPTSMTFLRSAGASDATSTLIAKLADPPASNDAIRVHVTVRPVPLQWKPSPPPLVKVIPTGSVSVTTIGSVVGPEPMLLTATSDLPVPPRIRVAWWRLLTARRGRPGEVTPACSTPPPNQSTSTSLRIASVTSTPRVIVTVSFSASVNVPMSQTTRASHVPLVVTALSNVQRGSSRMSLATTPYAVVGPRFSTSMVYWSFGPARTRTPLVTPTLGGGPTAVFQPLWLFSVLPSPWSDVTVASLWTGPACTARATIVAS